MVFKLHQIWNDSTVLLIIWQQLVISEILSPLYLLSFRSFCLFQLQEFKSWISNQKIDIYAFEFYHPKINISLAFRVLVKNKNSEIMEIVKERYNTGIWECSFKNQLQCCSNDIKLKMIQPHCKSNSRYLFYESIWRL